MWAPYHSPSEDLSELKHKAPYAADICVPRIDSADGLVSGDIL